MPQILIVDDQPEIRRLLSITLGKSYDILETGNGVTALELARQHRPAVMLLDIMMPGGLNGFQVLDAVRTDAHLKDTLIAVISARGGHADFDDADSLGADAYFVKPFSPTQVATWIREHIQPANGATP